MTSIKSVSRLDCLNFLFLLIFITDADIFFIRLICRQSFDSSSPKTENSHKTSNKSRPIKSHLLGFLSLNYGLKPSFSFETLSISVSLCARFCEILPALRQLILKILHNLPKLNMVFIRLFLLSFAFFSVYYRDFLVFQGIYLFLLKNFLNLAIFDALPLPAVVAVDVC